MSNMNSKDLLIRGKRQPFEPTIQYEYVLLGFLDEYMGRRVFKNGKEIEWFYPSELHTADKFENYLNMLIKEKRLTTTPEREGTDGDRIHFYSQEITALLNMFYGQEFEYERTITYPNLDVRYYTISEISHAIFKPITSARFKPDEFDSRFSYLLGVYERYGKENTIAFGNATHKAELVNKLLQEVRCDTVTWLLRQDCVPIYNKIEFTPTEELKALFGLQ